MNRWYLALIVFLSTGIGVADGFAQADAPAAGADEQDTPGLTLPETTRLRIRVSLMAGYIHDAATAALGFENQGRLGYGIIGLFGDVSQKLSYVFEINPVNEGQPLPACAEEGFFYTNTPQPFGPQVACEPDGRLHVDDYRFVALDPMNQQGPVRQAYLQLSERRVRDAVW